MDTATDPVTTKEATQAQVSLVAFIFVAIAMVAATARIAKDTAVASEDPASVDDMERVDGLPADRDARASFVARVRGLVVYSYATPALFVGICTMVFFSVVGTLR